MMMFFVWIYLNEGFGGDDKKSKYYKVSQKTNIYIFVCDIKVTLEKENKDDDEDGESQKWIWEDEEKIRYKQILRMKKKKWMNGDSKLARDYW